MLNLEGLKKLSVVLILVLSVCFMGSNAFAKEQVPKINFVGIEHSPLVVGDSESFYVTSDYDGMVQYRVWLNKVNTNTWEDITEGYTKAVDAKTPYVISPNIKFAEGKYKLSLWVKRAGVEGINTSGKGSYDTYYTANLNCVSRDDNNRVYVNDDVSIVKEEYALGEQVIIDGINNISGIKGPYKYKLHYFSPNKANDKDSGWVKNVTDYSDKIEWIPTEPGIYVLDVHVNTEKSTTWNTYIKKKKENKLDDVRGTYEAWKLKVITVKEKTQDEKSINLNEQNQVYGSLDESSYKVMNKEINFLAESVTLKNIKQTGNVNMLKDKGFLNNAEVIGDIIILGNYVKLNNVKVKGIITIDPGNSGVVYLDNVQADEIQILSGATESIHLNSVITPIVVINSNSNVRVKSTGNTAIDKISIKSNAILESANSNIKEVEIMPKGNSEIDLKGNFDLVNITRTVKLNLLEGKINKMYTIVPFSLKLEETAYITELDKNNLEVTVSAKKINIGTIKNDIAPAVPEGNAGGTPGVPVTPETPGTPNNNEEAKITQFYLVSDSGERINGTINNYNITFDIDASVNQIVSADINVSAVIKKLRIEALGQFKDKENVTPEEVNKLIRNQFNDPIDKALIKVLESIKVIITSENGKVSTYTISIIVK